MTCSPDFSCYMGRDAGGREYPLQSQKCRWSGGRCRFTSSVADSRVNNQLAHIFSNHEPAARRPHRVAHQLALKEIAIPLLSLLPCGMFGVQFIMGNRVAIS